MSCAKLIYIQSHYIFLTGSTSTYLKKVQKKNIGNAWILNLEENILCYTNNNNNNITYSGITNLYKHQDYKLMLQCSPLTCFKRIQNTFFQNIKHLNCANTYGALTSNAGGCVHGK